MPVNPYALSHLSDGTLLRGLTALVAQERTTTAALLAHLAEVDARKLYLPAAYPSMYAYCVGELHLSEDSAYKCIRAARTARRFPRIFPALAAGRLHLSAVVLLAPYLTPENADELLAAAAHQSRLEIEQLIAERFPRPDFPARIDAVNDSPTQAVLGTDPRAPGRVDELAPGPVERSAPEPGELSAPGRIGASALRPKAVPLAP